MTEKIDTQKIKSIYKEHNLIASTELLKEKIDKTFSLIEQNDYKILFKNETGEMVEMNTNGEILWSDIDVPICIQSKIRHRFKKTKDMFTSLGYN